MTEIWSKIYIGFHVKCPLFLPDFNDFWNVSTFFSKNSQILNFIKFHQVGTELFRAERNGEANSRFSQFCESPWRWESFTFWLSPVTYQSQNNIKLTVTDIFGIIQEVESEMNLSTN